MKLNHYEGDDAYICMHIYIVIYIVHLTGRVNYIIFQRLFEYQDTVINPYINDDMFKESTNEILSKYDNLDWYQRNPFN